MEALHTLGIDFKVIIAQIINFGLLLFLLTKFLYHPILKALEDRKKKITKSLAEAEEADLKTAMVEEEMKAKLAESKKEAAQIMDEAKTMAGKDKEKILLSATKEADRLKEAAAEHIESERQALYDEAKKRVGKLALFVITRSLQQDLGDKFYENNVNQALKEIESL